MSEQNLNEFIQNVTLQLDILKRVDETINKIFCNFMMTRIQEDSKKLTVEKTPD